MEPLDFYNDYVQPALSEWEAKPLSIPHLIWAVAEFDNLAEHHLLKVHSPVQKNAMGGLRDNLGAQAPFVGLARDVHDTHKHGALTRQTATIKQGQKPQKVHRGGAFGDGFSAGFDIGEPVLMIVDDAGKEYLAPKVMADLDAYWRRSLGI